jgi:hypothetical protein
MTRKKVRRKTQLMYSRFNFTLPFLKNVFGRFSARGVQKHHSNALAESPCREPFPESRHGLRCQFVVFLNSRLRNTRKRDKKKTNQHQTENADLTIIGGPTGATRIMSALLSPFY